jgi:cytochrome d ubiquinol oxidase subunit I
MMDATVDPVVLARVQFATNMTFHILFPTITIALGWFLLYFKLRFAATGEVRWMAAYGFWIKVFALSFALGVVSGVTMSFQFGTNWPGYMNTVGNIAGPLLGYEVLTAFFLEATFLGIMLFGRKRVGERMHTLATFLVAAGTTASAFWILALNSWMQTPAAFEMINGQAYPTSWWGVIFNPSFPYRLTHVLLASGLTASFLIAGLSAYRFMRGDRGSDVTTALRTAVAAAALLVPAQMFVGDLHGLNTLKHQPSKIAAMEGMWTTERGAALRLVAFPDEAAHTNHFEVAIPKAASLILTHTLDGEIKGLEQFPDHPPVAPLFWGFRTMVGTGVLMLAVSWLGAWQLRRGGSVRRWMQFTFIAMTFSGWIATVAGWYVTEIGRQPWLVYGVLRTADAASNVPAPMIGLSLAAYLTLYVVLLLSYVTVLFHLARKAGAGKAPSPVSLAQEA